jgi:hypothetical protein
LYFNIVILHRQYGNSGKFQKNCFLGILLPDSRRMQRNNISDYRKISREKGALRDVFTIGMSLRPKGRDSDNCPNDKAQSDFDSDTEQFTYAGTKARTR